MFRTVPFVAAMSIAVGLVGAPTAMQSTMPPCEIAPTTPPPPTPIPAPAAPANLRILGGSGGSLDAEWDLDGAAWEIEDEPSRGPSVWGAADAFTQTVNPHAYYFTLASRSDCAAAYSLRDAAQVEQYRRNQSSPAAVAYLYPNDPDPRKQDAAKVTIWDSRTSLSTQAWLPIAHPGRTHLFVTWDAWYGKEFIGAGISNYKTWQLGSPNEQIWTEIRTRMKQMAGPGEVGKVDLRQYNGYGPNTVLSPIGPQTGLDYGGVSVGPFTNEFGIMPETWTRHFVYLEYRPTEGWYRFSMWMADVNRNPVLVFNELQIRPRDGAKAITVDGAWDIFRVEFNTSDSGIPAGRGDLVAYTRNFVSLRGLSKTTALGLLQRPVN